jgi:hypothetical protein
VTKNTNASENEAKVGGAGTEVGAAEIVTLPARVSDVKLSPPPNGPEAPSFDILAVMIGRIRLVDKAS